LKEKDEPHVPKPQNSIQFYDAHYLYSGYPQIAAFPADPLAHQSIASLHTVHEPYLS